VRFTLNGHVVDIRAHPMKRLLDVLREDCGLTGTKEGCGEGECGACTVLLDGETAYACLTLAAACDGATVMTVEGLAEAESPAGLSALQRAFIAHDAAQCGFCTPGQLVAAHALLRDTPHPTDDQIRDAMSGNLCRCGTYPKILTAIRAVAAGEFAGGADAA
jgi:aerobic-type carbon monoxide dehydrogenase small subunit (CoxS/CutS family)